ncbi:hypothetical protein B0H14DRAFT_2630382 [Mycena olivaceomarginata]|nr:hypothetical protein B0H14DRAFT_2630382 [Mycena olivaceomarginata]
MKPDLPQDYNVVTVTRRTSGLGFESTQDLSPYSTSRCFYRASWWFSGGWVVSRVPQMRLSVPKSQRIQVPPRGHRFFLHHVRCYFWARVALPTPAEPSAPPTRSQARIGVPKSCLQKTLPRFFLRPSQTRLVPHASAEPSARPARSQIRIGVPRFFAVHPALFPDAGALPAPLEPSARTPSHAEPSAHPERSQTRIGVPKSHPQKHTANFFFCNLIGAVPGRGGHYPRFQPRLGIGGISKFALGAISAQSPRPGIHSDVYPPPSATTSARLSHSHLRFCSPAASHNNPQQPQAAMSHHQSNKAKFLTYRATRPYAKEGPGWCYNVACAADVDIAQHAAGTLTDFTFRIVPTGRAASSSFEKQREDKASVPCWPDPHAVPTKVIHWPDEDDVRVGFRADKGDVWVYFSADKGDVRAGSYADKGDVQLGLFTNKDNVLMKLHADKDSMHKARWGPSWGCHAGHGMGGRRAASAHLTCHMGATRPEPHCAVVSPSRDGICGRVAARANKTLVYPP